MLSELRESRGFGYKVEILHEQMGSRVFLSVAPFCQNLIGLATRMACKDMRVPTLRDFIIEALTR